VNFRVIYHQPVCPDCGSGQVSTEDVQTTDGFTETAHVCQDCGAAWPVACIAEQLRPETSPGDRRAAPHLVLRIDACPPCTGPATRRYWCPRCDVYLTGTELAATAAVVHYTPGPDRAITEADLTPSEIGS
jgi:hypothetical protein